MLRSPVQCLGMVLLLAVLAQGRPQRAKRATVEAVMPPFMEFGAPQSAGDAACLASIPAQQPLRKIECAHCFLPGEDDSQPPDVVFKVGDEWRGEWNGLCVNCGPCMARGARCTQHPIPEGGCRF